MDTTCSANVLCILPREMWCMVLDQLTTMADQENAANSISYFREILLEKRVHFLFPKIVNVMVSLKLPKPSSHCLHLNLKSLTKRSNIINLRLVCIAWNIAVEKCFEREKSSGMYPFVESKKKHEIGCCNPSEWATPYRFSVLYPRGAISFVNAFVYSQTGVQRNPFLGRLVVIYLGFQHVLDHVNDFVDSMRIILEKFGHEIWYVTLYINCSIFSTASNDYLMLRSWLNYMPNLRSLQIRFHNHGQVDPNVILWHPLPDLRALVCLKVSHLSVNILNEMFARYRHVNYLEIDDCGPVMGWTPATFTDLKELCIDAHRLVCTQIINWLGNQTKVENLFLYNHEQNLKLSRQFQMIKKCWSGSLKSLTLSVEEFQSEIFESTKDLQLKMPELSILKLYSYGNIYVDFILLLPNLRVLDVSIFNNETVIAKNYGELIRNNLTEQKIEFLGFENRMQESNIWSLMQNLRRVKISFTRRCPILHYDYVMKHSGFIVHKSYFEEKVKDLKLIHCSDLVFPKFQS